MVELITWDAVPVVNDLLLIETGLFQFIRVNEFVETLMLSIS